MATLLSSVQASPLIRPCAPVSKQVVFRPAAVTVSTHNIEHVLASAIELHGVSRKETRRWSVVAAAKKGGKGGKGGGDDDKADKGGKGKGGGGSSSSTDDLAKIEKEAKADAEDRMKKSLAALADNFNTIRTGRASPSILDKIQVTQFGAPTPLKSVAQVSVPDASTLLITPFDKSSLRDIEKALLETDIGINPSNDGEKIRLNVPPLTQERRQVLAKTCAKFGEDGKVALRNVRTDVMKKISKVDFSKDAKKDLEDAIQKMTDLNVKKVDEMIKTKTDEVMKL